MPTDTPKGPRTDSHDDELAHMELLSNTCDECGAVMGDPEKHERWHLWNRPVRIR